MTRPIKDRMAECRARMITERKRTPRVFYLGPEDYDEFMATEPPTVEAKFALPLGHKPRLHPFPGFDGLPVRRAEGKPVKGQSRLYCCNGTTVQVPVN